MKVRTYACPSCGQEQKDLRWEFDAPPTCANGHEPTATAEVVIDAFGRAAAVHGDDIPGGMLVEHAICNPDGTPRRFYSKSAIREEARQKGWTISGETPKPASKPWY